MLQHRETVNGRPAVLKLLCAALLLASCAGASEPGRDPRSGRPGNSAATAIRPALAGADLAVLQRDVRAVLDDLDSDRTGEVYPGAVEGTDPDALAVAVALIDGRSFGVGSVEARFPLMSISKPFTYALAVEQRGAAFLLERIGGSATGFPYNALAAGAVRSTSEQNPMVNAGAIATHSYIRGASSDEKIAAVVELYGRMAGRPLEIEEAWRATPRPLTYALAYQMQAAERLEGDVADVTQRYLEACIVAVRVSDLAQMGATLASGGRQPGSGRRILKRDTVRAVLSAMVVAGMYEESGRWWTRVGLPAKSGVSGAILGVAPGWGAVVAYSPRLDPAGNSVRGALAIERLADRWRLHTLERLLDAPPTEPPTP